MNQMGLPITPINEQLHSSGDGRLKPVPLIIGVHLHQPVGNFDSVLEAAYQMSYRPFLEVFTRFPSVKLVWHCSGYLLLWLEKTHPEYLAQLAELVAQERVEILTGGMYEPILPIIPPADRASQIRQLSRKILTGLLLCLPVYGWRNGSGNRV